MTDKNQKVFLSIAVLFLGVGIGLLGYFFFNQFINPNSQLAFIAGTSPSPSLSPTPDIYGRCGPAAKKYKPTEKSFSGNFCSKGKISETVNFPSVGDSTDWYCEPRKDSMDFCLAKHLPFAACGLSVTDTAPLSKNTLCASGNTPGFFQQQTISGAKVYTWKCATPYLDPEINNFYVSEFSISCQRIERILPGA